MTFTNSYNNDTQIYVSEKKGNYVFTKKELESKINNLHILYLQIHKVLGEDYSDMGDLIINVYDDGRLIDKLVIPKGEKSMKTDYIFGDIEKPK